MIGCGKQADFKPRARRFRTTRQYVYTSTAVDDLAEEKASRRTEINNAFYEIRKGETETSFLHSYDIYEYDWSESLIRDPPIRTIRTSILLTYRLLR